MLSTTEFINSLRCHITLQIMGDAVICTVDEQTYERAAISRLR
jgi:hypothetical protein